MLRPWFPSAAPPPTLLRAQVRVPDSYANRVRVQYGEDGQRALLLDVRRRVERMAGAGAVTLLALEDPTDLPRVDVLVRAPSGRLRVGSTDGVLRVVKLEGVREPPPLHDRLPSDLELDPGLVPEEEHLVTVALRTETHPGHLRGLAGTFEPNHPVAATLLRARAEAIERERPGYRPSTRRTPIPAPTASIAALRGRLLARAAREQHRSELLDREGKRVVCILAEDPASGPELLSRFPPELVELAAHCLDPVRFRDGKGGVVYVASPIKVSEAFPPSAYDGHVSPSAVQLVLAASKPHMSGVTNVARAKALVQTFENDTENGARDPDGGVRLTQARAALETAQRALQRRRWIEYGQAS